MSVLAKEGSISLSISYSSLVGKVLVANALLILGAKIAIPFYPVPLSLQTLAIMGVALFAGRKVAMISTIAYLLEGAIGLPVFVSMEAGPSMFIGTRAGYLIGFLVLSYICSTNIKIFKNSFFNSIAIQITGLTALYIVGVGYLATLIGPSNAISFGLVPFILGAMCKVLLIAVAKNAHENRSW